MSRAVLVDTDVFSFLYKRDTRAVAYDRHLAGTSPRLAFATVAELHRWAIVRGWGRARVDALRNAIAKYAVLHSDDATTLTWARVTSVSGRPMGPADAWVAAVAIRHGLPLVTHNRKHFDGITGLTVLSEG